jgi:SulP family sulfate permease
LIYILELQGLVFFGTANRLLEQVRRRVDDPDQPAPRFVLLDFRQVDGLDASAVLSFARMKQLAQARGFVLVLTALSDPVRQRLASEICTGEDQALCHIDLDLDHGVEWCEEQLLALAIAGPDGAVAQTADEPGEPWQVDGLASLLEAIGGQAGVQGGTEGLVSISASELGEFLERREVSKGQYLIHQGDAPQGLYVLETGQVTALREGVDGSLVRLRKMGPGSIVGEMGLYLGIPAAASVVTDQPSTVYYLPAGELERMEQARPELAAALHRYVAQLLGERLARANDTLQALLD